MDLQTIIVPEDLKLHAGLVRRQLAIKPYFDGLVENCVEIQRAGLAAKRYDFNDGVLPVFSSVVAFLSGLGSIGAIMVGIHDGLGAFAYIGWPGSFFVSSAISTCWCVLRGRKAKRAKADATEKRRHAFRALAFIDEHAEEAKVIDGHINEYLASKQSVEELKANLGSSESVVQAEQLLEERHSTLAYQVADFLGRLDEAAKPDAKLVALLDNIERVKVLERSSTGAMGDPLYRGTRDNSLYLVADEMKSRIKREADGIGIDQKLLPPIGT